MAATKEPKGQLKRTTLEERDRVAEGLVRANDGPGTGTVNYRKRVGRDEEAPTNSREAVVSSRVIGVNEQRPRDGGFVEQLATDDANAVRTDARNHTAKPSNNLLTAKDAKHSAFRTTMQLRQIAQDIGINPVEVLMWMSAGLAPKFVPYTDADGKQRLRMEIDQDGNQIFEKLIVTEQLVAAKEASKYLYPQLKAVDLGKDLTDGTAADENVNKAMQTFANLARLALGGNQHAKIVTIEEEPGDGESED